MAIVIRFNPASMNAAQYDSTIRGLEAAGEVAPAGRLFHACYGQGDQLRVFDVWDSMEAFERFGHTLRPLIEQAGIDTGAPEVIPVHNTLAGDAAPAAVTLEFHPVRISAASYDETMRRLDAAGPDALAGLVFHTCYGTGDDLRIFDAWSSAEAPQRFAPSVLFPILAEVGIDPGHPQISPVHSTITGAAAAAAA